MKFDNSISYISICLFPSCESFVKCFAQFETVECGNVKITDKPHVTLLYAPLADGVNIDNVKEELIKRSSEIKFTNILSFDHIYISDFNTVNLSVIDKSELICWHNYLVEALEQYLHPLYIQVFKSGQFNDDLLDLLHTSNIGQQYSPHLTLGKSRKKIKSLVDSLKKQFLSKHFSSELYLNRAPENTLIKQYKIF